jgi:hypothetical protein
VAVWRNEHSCSHTCLHLAYPLLQLFGPPQQLGPRWPCGCDWEVITGTPTVHMGIASKESAANWIYVIFTLEAFHLLLFASSPLYPLKKMLGVRLTLRQRVYASPIGTAQTDNEHAIVMGQPHDTRRPLAGKQCTLFHQAHVLSLLFPASGDADSCTWSASKVRS